MTVRDGVRVTANFLLAAAPRELASVTVVGGTVDALARIPGAASERRAEDLNGLSYDIRDVTAKAGVRTALGDVSAMVNLYDEGSNTYLGLTGAHFVGSVKNITDRVYIVSRRPEGIKVGLPRLVTLDISWDF